MKLAKQTKVWPIFLLGGAIVAIILLSAGLSSFELLPGRPFPVGILNSLQLSGPLGRPAPSGFLGFLLNLFGALGVLFFFLILVLWIITYIIRPKARKRLLNRMIGYIILFLLMYGLITAVQQMRFTGEGEIQNEATSGLEETTPPSGTLLTPPTFVVDPPQWFVVVVTLGATILILGVIWFFWRRRPRSQEDPPIELLIQEARQAIEELHAGSNLKDTVMRCYQAMNRVLREQRGIERKKGMTPREFETHLSEVGFGDEHIRRLTRLFEAVRYGANTPSQREEQEAIACLRAIVESYGRSA